MITPVRLELPANQSQSRIDMPSLSLRGVISVTSAVLVTVVAVVTLAAINELKLPAEKVNVHGGACALGHPIGSSGSRIIVTLINALKQRGLKRGVASLCIGGGEATAVAIELI